MRRTVYDLIINQVPTKNNINLVLAILSDSLFISSHSLILESSSFIKQFGSMFGVLVRLLTVLKSVVSSAYDINVKLDWHVKSRLCK